MKKIFTIIFLMLTLGTIAYSQNKDNETIFGIKMGADFETVDSVMKSKGFSMKGKINSNSDVTQFGYKGGTFANTKPFILMTISAKNGLTSCNISWNCTYYIETDEALNDEIITHYMQNNDSVNMQKRVCIKNKQKFSTLINTLNKKYGCNIELPDQFAKFSYLLYSNEKLSVSYAFDGGETLADCMYILSYVSKLWEQNISDDL
ncbi:MAG: hypothetical protein IJP90_00405 [Treponema sp.]|nr:hypothetical protein [Treponema sp.]MBR0098164.1 hypothetical protein [Treponema sp.]